MADKPTYEELEQRVEALEKDARNHRAVEEALKDYVSYQSVLAVLHSVKQEETEEALLQTVVSEIVKQYGFSMSWYGQYANGEIRPILSAGRVDRYLDDLVLQIREPTSPDARCAMSQAILNGAPFSYADLEADEGFRRWRDYALELGYRSNLALPLTVDGQLEGGVMVYADSPNAFPEKRMERLQLLTFEIGALLSERRLKRKTAQRLQNARHELERRVKKRTAALVNANKRLKREMDKRKRAEEAIRRERDKAQGYLNIAGAMFVVIDPDERVSLINKKSLGILGLEEQDVVGKNWFDSFVPERMREEIREIFQKLMTGDVQPVEYYENPVSTGSGSEKMIAWHNTVLTDEAGNITGTLSSGIDITQRQRAEKDLREKDAQLIVKANNLEELNTALRVLLKGREKDKEELEEKVLSNVKDLVFPYLEKLKNTSLDHNQISCISILESNLNDIISPFSRRLSSKYWRLTPREVRVANLVKEGKTTKEIARFMNLSGKTVETYRDNIRKKWG
jgi:PAS domain S-box-containing protein